MNEKLEFFRKKYKEMFSIDLPKETDKFSNYHVNLYAGYSLLYEDYKLQQAKIDAQAKEMADLRVTLAHIRHHACYSVGESEVLSNQLNKIRKIIDESVNPTPLLTVEV